MTVFPWKMVFPKKTHSTGRTIINRFNARIINDGWQHKDFVFSKTVAELKRIGFEFVEFNGIFIQREMDTKADVRISNFD